MTNPAPDVDLNIALPTHHCESCFEPWLDYTELTCESCGCSVRIQDEPLTEEERVWLVPVETAEDKAGLGDRPAFPASEQQTDGLSMREHFAGLAMQGLLAARAGDDSSTTDYAMTFVARNAVIVADRLLTELARPREGRVS